MKAITTIGIDLAKNSFSVYGVDAKGKPVLKRSLTRSGVTRFFANLPGCLVGMEACASSEYWARTIESLGHTVRRIHPRYVKAYLVGAKNDANDAAAICEAVKRPNMRFVPHKSPEQMDIQATHRIRQGFVRSRTALVNQARGLLGEYGLVIPQGTRHIRKHLPAIIADEHNGLSSLMRRNLASLYESLCFLDRQIAEQEITLKTIAKENESCKRLMRIPGVGFLTATILLSVAGVASNFTNGREFAAFLGLVPRQNSTGGKTKLLGISKRGDKYVRTLMVHGARAVLSSLLAGRTPEQRQNKWLAELAARRGAKRACVGLANKTARIAWSLLAHGTEYTIAV
ncbi:MAG: IS110 family transposase [Desulfovibrio sp.]|nr:IS110 family transposase [Desulfovibrio sp.]